MQIIFIIFLVIAYLIGSINSAIIVAKIMNLPDPREEGSNNPGATNMMRLGGKNAAIITLIGDVLKGLIPVLLLAYIGVSGFYLALTALCAVLGHMYPIFFKFQGGKGVATSLGAFFGLSLALGIIVLIVFAGVFFYKRMVSLASMAAIIAAPIIAVILGHFGYFIPLAVIAGLVVFRHMDNIKRLRAGTESKFEM